MLGDSCNGGMPERTPGVERDGEEEGEEREKEGVQGVQEFEEFKRTTYRRAFWNVLGQFTFGRLLIDIWVVFAEERILRLRLAFSPDRRRFPRFLKPSPMFAGIEMAARLAWLTRQYCS